MPRGGTCYETVAASATADDNVTYAVVYGATNASDITAYRPNEHGMIDLSMVAGNPSAEFILRDGNRGLERFANIETTVALYNATHYYSRLYPDDAELMVTNSSLADGTGSAAHPNSHGRPNSAIDFRYLDENGQRLRGPTAAARAGWSHERSFRCVRGERIQSECQRKAERLWHRSHKREFGTWATTNSATPKLRSRWDCS